MKRSEYSIRGATTGRRSSSLIYRAFFFVHILAAAGVLLVLLHVPAGAASTDVSELLKTYVQEQFPWSEIEISDIKLNREVPAETPLSISLEKNPPGRTIFHLEFSNQRTVTAIATVKAYDQIIMSRSAFRKGHALAGNDVYAARMDVSRIPQGALRDEARIIGKPLIRSIVPNVPLTDTMVSDMPMIKKGRKIILMAQGSGLTIKAPGEMKQDGVVGSYVNAINLLSKKLVTGMLVDENTVRVEF